MNPVLRAFLPTPIGRLISPFALLEFDGARTGRHYRVPVGWHDIAGRPVVFTPAPWRVNLRGGVPVTVHHRGRRCTTTATLDNDADSVAASLRHLATARGSLRAVGIRLPPGHEINATDVRTLDRAAIRFEPDLRCP